jgi:PDZ domain/Aspartyl protease
MRNLVVSASLIAGVLSGVTPGEAASADPVGSAPAELMAPPGARGLAEVQSNSVSRAVVPISIEAGEVVVDVSINGRGPFPFIFDTGAQGALTPETVAALGLKTEGAGTLQDSGSHSISITSTRVAAMRLGDLEMTDQPFFVVPLPRHLTDRGNRVPLAGFIGDELFARFAVRLDYDNRTLTLTPDSDFRYDGEGVRVPLLSRDKTPAVSAAADGISGFFALRIKSLGAGGSFDTILSRLDTFEVAESRIDRPATRFPSTATEGLPFADIAGSIGYEILRQFTITFDYRRRELWFERSRAFGMRTGQGGAGFQAFKIDGAGFRVITVLPDAAAAAAGLQVGDVVTEVDGRSTASMSVSELAELLRRPIGTSVHLGTVRDGNVRPVALTLKDVLP